MIMRSSIRFKDIYLGALKTLVDFFVSVFAAVLILTLKNLDANPLEAIRKKIAKLQVDKFKIVTLH